MTVHLNNFLNCAVHKKQTNKQTAVPKAAKIITENDEIKKPLS